MGANDIARLARALVTAYERGGRAFALNRMVGGSKNWRLRAMMADDSFFSNAAEWDFGGPGALCVCVFVFWVEVRVDGQELESWVAGCVGVGVRGMNECTR